MSGCAPSARLGGPPPRGRRYQKNGPYAHSCTNERSGTDPPLYVQRRGHAHALVPAPSGVHPLVLYPLKLDTYTSKVIPAQAGIQFPFPCRWMPAFAGMTLGHYVTQLNS